jgi:hypothetical protein
MRAPKEEMVIVSLVQSHHIRGPHNCFKMASLPFWNLRMKREAKKTNQRMSTSNKCTSISNARILIKTSSF